MNTTTKAPERRSSFAEYLAEMEGYLTNQFGVAADAINYDVARDYYVTGRSPEFCAYAIARLSGVKFGP